MPLAAAMNARPDGLAMHQFGATFDVAVAFGGVVQTHREILHDSGIREMPGRDGLGPGPARW